MGSWMSRIAWGTSLGLLLSPALWWVWLGHDDEPSYDVIADQVQDPYTTLQVVGCALAVAVLTIVLAALTEPISSTLASGVGFWTAWTLHAARTDESGLFIVGAVMLAFGLVAGLSLCGLMGFGLGQVLRRRRAAA